MCAYSKCAYTVTLHLSSSDIGTRSGPQNNCHIPETVIHYQEICEARSYLRVVGEAAARVLFGCPKSRAGCQGSCLTDAEKLQLLQVLEVCLEERKKEQPLHSQKF